MVGLLESSVDGIVDSSDSGLGVAFAPATVAVDGGKSFVGDLWHSDLGLEIGGFEGYSVGVRLFDQTKAVDCNWFALEESTQIIGYRYYKYFY